MRFPVSFTRYVGGTNPALGSDSDPTSSTEAPAKQDNVLSTSASSISAFPVQRIAVTYGYVGEGSPGNLDARMYFFEDQSQQWYLVGAQQALVPGTVTFFDCLSIGGAPPGFDPVSGRNTLHGGTASPALRQMLIVDATGEPPNGTYIFGMAPDLTNSP